MFVRNSFNDDGGEHHSFDHQQQPKQQRANIYNVPADTNGLSWRGGSSGNVGNNGYEGRGTGSRSNSSSNSALRRAQMEDDEQRRGVDFEYGNSAPAAAIYTRPSSRGESSSSSMRQPPGQQQQQQPQPVPPRTQLQPSSPWHPRATVGTDASETWGSNSSFGEGSSTTGARLLQPAPQSPSPSYAYNMTHPVDRSGRAPVAASSASLSFGATAAPVAAFSSPPAAAIKASQRTGGAPFSPVAASAPFATMYNTGVEASTAAATLNSSAYLRGGQQDFRRRAMNL